VHEDEQQEPVEAINKDEEEVDPYAQEKAESSATIDKITKLVTKIEETVARHKIKADTLMARYENPLVFDQQLHQSAKTNRYDTGMSSEFLMKHLMRLDNCLSYGCGVIRSSRKVLVCRIKEIMARADSLSQQWLKHVQALEKLKTETTACKKTTDIESADDVMGIEEMTSDTDEASDSAPEMDVEESSDDEIYSSDDDVEEENTASSDSQTTSPSSSSSSSENHTETKQRESVRLPLWKPRSQMYHDDSHVIVAAFVPGMTMDQLNVVIDETDLVITGQKHPTMQDIISYRHGRGQNFGDLKLKIPLPTDVVSTEGATATCEDNVLRVKFLKKPTPQYYRRQSPLRQAWRQPMHNHNHQPMHNRRPMRYRHPMYNNQQPRLRQFSHPLSFW